MCDMRPATPAFFTAATESPPPITVVQPASVSSASVSATASVPFANASISKTPIGPFHTTVPAPLSSLAIKRIESGPISRPIMPSGIAVTETTRQGESASKRSATTASVGRSRLTPLALASLIKLAASESCSSSTIEVPTASPCDLRNVKHIAPPITIVSHRCMSDVSTGSFDETFEPPTIAMSGRFGAASTASFIYLSSF
mmetsp:Transcript_27510/g.62259  ORF Transcript_27510/g.62259 Transcript_27510/m.62259 type:complete len:201 (+) Transcript_27510:477-1079(+)